MRKVKTVGVNLLHWYIPTEKKKFNHNIYQDLISIRYGQITIDQYNAHI